MNKLMLVVKAMLTTSLLISGTSLYLSNESPVEAANSILASSPPTTLDSTIFMKSKWQTTTDGMGLYDSKPAISNGIIYYSSGGTLNAAEIATGNIIWTYNNGLHPQIVTNNSVFFINTNGYLVKVNAKTGKLLWKVKAATAPIEIGAVAELINGVVYFTNESGGIAAYNPVSGKQIWENKKIPMYAGGLLGEYDGVLLVYATVDNIRSQFFGLDPASGRKLWRTEGDYTFLTYQDGQFTFRDHSDATYQAVNAPVPGYLMTLVKVDVTTGKVTKKENYQSLVDISRLGNSYTSLQGSYAYTADGNLDQSDDYLTRHTLDQGADTDTHSTSYEEYGDWLVGPVNGMAYFQKGTQITGVNVNNGSIVKLTGLASPVLSLQLIGKGLYIGYGNGYFSIMNIDTGSTLGILKTGAMQFGKTFITHGQVFIPTEDHLFAVTLPQELQ